MEGSKVEDRGDGGLGGSILNPPSSIFYPRFQSRAFGSCPHSTLTRQKHKINLDFTLDAAQHHIL